MSSATIALPRLGVTPLALTQGDRRRSIRWPVTGHATAVVRVIEKDETHNRICPLQLVNISDTGAGVFCEETIPLGSQISVFVMPDGAEAGYDLAGTVVRCNARDDHGHTVGVRLASRLAA